MEGNEIPSTTQGIATTSNPSGIQPAPVTAPTPETVPVVPAAPVAPVAPVVAPVAPVVDPAKPLSVDVPATVPVVFESTGNPTLDIVNDFIGSKGIAPDSAEYLAALKGDFSQIEAKLKGMGDNAKGYERYLNSAKQEFENAKAAHEQKHGATIAACHDMAKEVGGWDSLSEWVRTTADPSELAEINEALAAGGMAAKQVTRYLVDLRKQHPDKGDPTPPKSPVKETASTVRDATGGALTAVQFQKEIGKLMDKFGTNYVYQAEYKDLCARREKSRG